MLTNLPNMIGCSTGFQDVLRQVRLVAPTEATRLLALCETKGTELRNCPAYIREWVNRESARTRRLLSELKAGASEDIEDV